MKHSWWHKFWPLPRRCPGCREYRAYIPGFSQGMPEAPELPRHRVARHTYGAERTIHQTGTLDIQLKPDGRVYAVWFRCRTLPFRVSYVGRAGSVGDLNEPDLAIEEIIYVDRSEAP